MNILSCCGPFVAIQRRIISCIISCLYFSKDGFLKSSRMWDPVSRSPNVLFKRIQSGGVEREKTEAREITEICFLFEGDKNRKIFWASTNFLRRVYVYSNFNDFDVVNEAVLGRNIWNWQRKVERFVLGWQESLEWKAFPRACSFLN